MSDWNLFEQIVMDAMEAQKYPRKFPRLCVRRLSRGPDSFGWMAEGEHPLRGKFRRFLDTVPESENLTPYFTLCAQWQQPEESEFMELDNAHYFGQSGRPRGRAQLEFSLPAQITTKTWCLYFSVYHGPLFAYSGFYYFTGDPAEPRDLRQEIHRVS